MAEKKEADDSKIRDDTKFILDIMINMEPRKGLLVRAKTMNVETSEVERIQKMKTQRSEAKTINLR